MKFTVDRAPLLQALQRVHGAAGNGRTIPILSFVLLKAAADGHLEIRATDLQVEATCEIAATVDDPGAACVSASLLLDVVRSAPDGAEIGFAPIAGDARLAVRVARSSFKLPTLPASDFTKPRPATPGETRGTLPAKDLLRLLDKTSFASGADNADREFLRGVYLHRAGDDAAPLLVAAATDGLTLAHCELACPASLLGMPGAILPNRIVGEIRRLVGDLSCDVTLAIDEGRIAVEIQGARLASPLITGPYPDYRRVIPVNPPNVLGFPTGQLKAAVRRALICSAAAGESKVRAVRFSLSAGELRVAAWSMERGEADEVLEAAGFDGEPVQLVFNGPMLAELIDRVDGDQVELAFGVPTDPVIVRDPADALRQTITMPLRV